MCLRKSSRSVILSSSPLYFAMPRTQVSSPSAGPPTRRNGPVEPAPPRLTEAGSEASLTLCRGSSPLSTRENFQLFNSRREGAAQRLRLSLCFLSTRASFLRNLVPFPYRGPPKVFYLFPQSPSAFPFISPPPFPPPPPKIIPDFQPKSPLASSYEAAAKLLSSHPPSYAVHDTLDFTRPCKTRTLVHPSLHPSGVPRGRRLAEGGDPVIKSTSLSSSEPPLVPSFPSFSSRAPSLSSGTILAKVPES